MIVVDATMKSLHLLYHELRPARSQYSYVTPCEEFEKHCELFSKLIEQEPADVLHPEITFDDGNVSDVEHALPILERHGLKATFFITAGWTGKKTGFMNQLQLQALFAAGHRIGAHGMTHKLLTACTEIELQQELRGAKERLEDGLGTSVSIMSLPGGRANGRVLRACDEAGYLQVFTSAPRSESMEKRPKTIGRLNLLSDTSPAWLLDVLRPGTGALARLQRAYQVKTAAKLVLGDGLYEKIWALVNRQETTAAEEASAP